MANEIPLLNKAKNADRLVRDIGNKIEGVLSSLDRMGSRAEASMNKAVRGIQTVGTQAQGTARQIESAASSMGSWANSADRLGKSLANFNLNILSQGINLLITGIQRVYELKERWAKITGELNMKIGGLSANMRTAQRFMSNWEGKVRGLTDSFGQGAAMAGEFLETMETMNKTVLKSSQFMGLVLARGFNLGARSTGELMKAFRGLNVSTDETMKDFAELAVLSERFEVPLNGVAKSISEAGGFMLQFGKSGKKAFMQGAVYLKQFNVEMKSMAKFMGAFDTLDDAAQNVSKLNMVFGTTLSSLDVMMTQDPTERLEMIRNQMLAQGKTWNTMSRTQRQILSQTLQLSEEEAVHLFDSEKAHISLAKFREQSAKTEVKEAKAKKLMQVQLQKTSQTMYAFGAAFDRITVAIAKAIRPLLEMLGLAKSSDKEWKSFGNVMESFTNTFVRLFEGLAKSPQWISFLEKVAASLKKIMNWVTSLTTSDFTNFFEKAIDYTKKFALISGGLIALWTGSKALSAISNIGKIAGGAISKIGVSGGKLGDLNNRVLGTKVFSGQTGKVSYRSNMMTRGAAAIGGAGIGLGMSQLTGDGSNSSNIGGALGGAIGMLAGPIGSAIGGAVGAWLGANSKKILDKIVDSGAKTEGFAGDLKTKNSKQKEEIEKSIEIKKKSIENLENVINAKRKVELTTLSIIERQQGNKISLNKEEQKMISEVALGMKTLGIKTNLTEEQLNKLSKNDGTFAITRTELETLTGKMSKYYSELDKLAIKTSEMAGITDSLAKMQQERAKLELAETLNKVKIERGISDLRLLGEKELASKIEKEGFLSAEKDISKKAQDAFNKRQALQELETRMGKQGFIIDKNNMMQTKDQLKLKIKTADQEVKRWESIQSITGKYLGVENQVLEQANKQLRFDEKKLELDLLNQNLRMMDPSKMAIAQKILSQPSSMKGNLISAGLSLGLSPEEAKLVGSLIRVKGEMNNTFGSKLASGGIVSRPTRALIGENGPEAIIPLRAMASGKLRNPSKFGGAAAQKLVNFASKNSQTSSGGNETRIVAGDVYLDGRMVGRHIVRNIIENTQK